MNRILIGSSATRQLHGLYTEAIKPTSTTPPHLNTFTLPSLGHLTRRFQEHLYPHFITPASCNSINTVPKIELETKNIVTKKFVFHKSKVTQLKAMAAVRGVHNPTPFQVLSALILKCAKAAAATAGPTKGSPLFQFVDTRPKVVPQLPKTCVSDLRALKEQIMKRKMEREQCQEKLGRDEVADATKNMLVLMDAPSGDSIEALVTLETGCMTTFQQDKQLLQFASL